MLFSISSGGVVGISAVTETTSSTTGALTVAGGVGIAKDLNIGDDLKLSSDQSVFSMGADDDFTITHDNTTGVTLAATPINITSASAATWKSSAGNLTIDSEAANLILDGHTGVQIDASNSGNIELNVAASNDILIGNDAVAADIKLGNAVNTTTEIELNAVLVDINSGTGGITMDTTGILAINSAGGASNISHTATADGDFTITMDGAVDASLILSSTGTGADALQVTATAGGIINQFAQDKSYTIKNANNDLSIVLTDDNTTAGNEKIVLTNTNGTDEASITITSTAGGVDIDAAAGKDVNISGGQLTLSSKTDEASAISLTTNVGTSETIVVTNTKGNGEGAIALTATAGGVDIDAAAGKDVNISGGQLTLSSKTDEASAISLTTNVGTSETIVVTNTKGEGEGAIALTATAGGVDIDAAAGKDVNIAGGQVALVSKDNAASAISLTTNVGTTETIVVTNTLGDGEGAIALTATAGGVDIDAAVTKDVNIAGGQVALVSKDNAASAISLTTNVGTTETIVITNTQGDTDGTAGAGAIALTSTAGGIGLLWNDAKDLWAEGGRAIVTANENAAEAIKLHADAGANQTIVLVNDAGTDNGAIALTATSGGITNQFAQDKTYTIKNANNDLSIVLTDDNTTAGNEKIVLTNTNGTDEASITITSTAGGVDIDAAAGKDINISGGQLTLSSKTDEASAISLTTNVGTSETIVVTNTLGEGEGAIALTATAGGVDIDAAAGKDINISGGQLTLSSKTNEANAISLTTNVGILETIAITNTVGTDNAAVAITASAGGMDITSAKALDISTSANNADITLTPHGTGDVKLLSDTVTVGDSAAAATLTSNGAGTLTVTTGGASDLILSTNSGTDSGTITLTDGVNGNITINPNGTGTVTIQGNLAVSGTTTTVSSTNTVITDNLIELNNGATNNANDCGILIERGSAGDNAFIGWDESVDKFVLGTTTATGSSSDANLTIANADLQIKGIDSGTDTLTLTTVAYDLNATGEITIDASGSNDISIGANANTGDINIGNGASARTITVGNDASTKVDVNALIIELDSAGTIETNSTTTTAITSGTTMTLSSGGILAMDTVGTDAINIGTQAAAKTITIGNDASAKVDVNALIIELDSAGTIETNSTTTTALASGTTFDIQATGNLTLDSSGGTIGIGTDEVAGAINIGTNAHARNITIGADESAKVDVNALIIELDSAGTIITDSTTTTAITSGTTMTLSSGGILAMDTVGTDAINIGTQAAAKTITIGNDASAKVDVNALIIELDSAGTIETNSTTTTALASGTTFDIQATGNLTLDSSGGTIGIGTDEVAGAINIGTNAHARNITIGADESAKVDVNALIIELDSAGTIITDSTTTTAITSGTTMTLSSGGILAMDTVGTDAINIGTQAAAKTITIGNDASAKVDVNALIIELDSAGTIETNSTTTTALASGTTFDIQATGNLTLDSSGGTIGIGTDEVAGAINIGTNAHARNITIGADESAKVDVNALIIELDSAGTIITDSTTTTAITSGTTMTLSSGGILAMDTVGTDAINIGTQAAAKTITIGNDASAKVDVNALIIELDSAGTIETNSTTTTALASGTTFDIQATGNLTLDSSGGTIGIGTDEVAGAINIGTNAHARNITIGADESAKVDVNALIIELDSAGTIITDSTTTTAITSGTTMTLSSGGILAMDTVGTDAINIGIQAAAKTITIGNDASAKVDVNALIIELDSSGTIETNSTTTTTLASGTTFDIQATGNLTLDSSGGTIGIGTDEVAGAINIGTNAHARNITIGADESAKVDVNALIIELDSAGTIEANSTTTTAITSGTTMTLSSGGILAMDTVGTDAINIGIQAAAKTITIGNDASAKVDVNALIIELDSAGTIETNSTTTTALASGTTFDIQATGNLTLDSSGGTIGIGTDEVAGAINIGTNAHARNITIGADESAKVDVNALIIELDSAGTIDTNSTTTTAITSGTTMTLSSGGILAMDTVGTDAINIGIQAAAKTITIGNDASAKVDVNALIIELDSAGTIEANSTTTTAITSGTTMTLSSGGILAMDTVGTDAINIGIQAAAKTITIGNDASAKVDVNALIIELDSAGSIVTDSVTTTTMTSTGNFSIDAADASSINIGTSTTGTHDTSTINVGTSATARTINVGNAASTALNLDADAVTITSVAALSLTDGDATLNFNGSGATTLTTVAYDHNASGAITIDTTDTTNGITLGTATSAVPISIGHTTSEVTVNDNLTVTGTVTINGGAINLGVASSLKMLDNSSTAFVFEEANTAYLTIDTTNDDESLTSHKIFNFNGGANFSSDDRIKHNEESVTNAMDIINKLKGYKYYKSVENLHDENHNYELDSNNNPVTNEKYIVETGFIAQDVEQISELSHLVTSGNDNKPYGLRYLDIFNYNVVATQELDNKITQLEKVKYMAVSNIDNTTTLTASSMLNGMIVKTGSSSNDTTCSASELIASIPNCYVGASFEFYYRNNTSSNISLLAGNGCTLDGTNTTSANNTRKYLVIVNNVTSGSEAYTVYSMGENLH